MLKRRNCLNKQIFLIFCLILILFITPIISAKSYYIDRVDATYLVNTDGSINVTQEMDFVFSGSFSEAFINIPLSGSERIENFFVQEKSNGVLTPLTSHTKNNFEGIWNYTALNETKTFVVSYLLKNSITEYNDAHDFYWKLWGDEWDVSVNNFSTKIIFPVFLDQKSKVWLYSNTNAEWRLEKNVLTITSKHIPPKTFLEVRVLFNKEVIPTPLYTKKINSNGYDKIVSESNSLLNNQFLFGLSSWVFFLVIIIVLSGAYYYYYKKHGVEPVVEKVLYERDIPFDDKPYIVDYLMNLKFTVNGLKGTILDLVRRNYISIEEVIHRKSIFSKKDFKLTKLRGEKGLSYSEKFLLKKLFLEEKKTGWASSMLVEKQEVLLSKVTKVNQKNRKSLFQLWLTEVNKELLSMPKETDSSKSVLSQLNPFIDFTGKKKFGRVLLIISILFLIFVLILHSTHLYLLISFLCVVTVFNYLILSIIKTPKQIFSLGEQVGKQIIKNFYITILILFFVFILFKTITFNTIINLFPLLGSTFIISLFFVIQHIFASILPKRTLSAAKRFEHWSGLKRFFDDFDLMKEKKHQEVVLWEKYLVYATVFGNSKKVLKNFDKTLLTKLEKSNSSMHLFTSTSFYTSFNNSLTNSFSSSSSSTGRGFSSSGGGRGGGGGGGGAR